MRPVRSDLKRKNIKKRNNILLWINYLNGFWTYGFFVIKLYQQDYINLMVGEGGRSG